MAQSSPPNYVEVQSRPVWSNGSDVSTFGSKRIKPNEDIIMAVDINNLRDSLDVVYNHTHDYTDSIGSC